MTGMANPGTCSVTFDASVHNGAGNSQFQAFGDDGLVQWLALPPKWMRNMRARNVSFMAKPPLMLMSFPFPTASLKSPCPVRGRST
jgi:hypothetical protein